MKKAKNNYFKKKNDEIKILLLKKFAEVFGDLESIGEGIGVTIRCQRAEIFEKMHRL